MFKYRIILVLAWLVLPFVFVHRLFSGKDNVATFLARLGYSNEKCTNPRLIWLHAASLGEFNTLELLLPVLSRKFQNYDFLVTVSNRLTFEKVKRLRLRSPALHADIAPLDFNCVLNRFFKRWKPTCLITIENEVYPNRNLKCSEENIPIVFVNARMSEKSFCSWQKDEAFARKVFQCIDFCFPQDQGSAVRFSELGVAPDRIKMLGNLKQFQEATEVTHPDADKLRAVFDPVFTLCAASTHKGEDQIILDAFSIARRTHPNLKLILVPRHPKRAHEIKALSDQAGLSCAVRSEGALPMASNDIYLADTMGEMPLWYSSAAVTFVAGSLVPVGGHTPFEPAAFGSAIIHGSQYSNFKAIYEELVSNKGSIQADTADDIATAWIKLLGENPRNAQISASKKSLFENNAKDKMLDEIVSKVASFL